MAPVSQEEPAAKTGGKKRKKHAETAVRLKHMIASHHGQLEFGAAKTPMTLEALALHHIDHLDAKMAGVVQLLQNEASMDGGWTQYQQSQGRKFFRGRGQS
jgi:3'-5' exoribonuclease